MEKVNITQMLALFDDYWHPRVVGELNGQQVKLVKFTGPFVAHGLYRQFGFAEVRYPSRHMEKWGENA